MATRDEIENLKRTWDGSWDLHTTAGFEEHEDELREYEFEVMLLNNRRRMEVVYEKAKAIGCPGNTRLAFLILKLESRITDLEKRLSGE